VSHLHTSALTVSAFMRDLFADKLRDQEKVLASVKRIADSALIHTPEAFAADPLPSGPSSGPPGAASVSDVSRVEPRGGLGWLVFAVAIAAFIFAVSSGQQWQEVSVAKGRWFTFDDGSDGKTASAARADDPPAPATGKLTVSASGSGCQVQVDGKHAGHSPLVDFVLTAGQHAIGCTPSASRAFSVNVRIDPGETAHVGFVLP
jgi:hypothetical protein